MRKLSRRVSIIMALLMILSVSSNVFANNVENVTITAKPNNSTVLVNGEEVVFESYNINGNNYFKLRDLAKIVSGTEKQFEVKWDNDKKAIELISNSPYTEVGGELAAGDSVEKTAILNTSTIYKDGAEIELTAYTINNNNFFKLRDIAQSFDIGVTWDGETSTVGIDTSIGYESVQPEVDTEPTETEVEETTEEAIEETQGSEVSTIGASFISPLEIVVDFGQPLSTTQAGDTYVSLVYLDWDGLSPWEIGIELTLEPGPIGYVLDLSELVHPEFELPGAGTYELNFGDFGAVVLEASEELFK